MTTICSAKLFSISRCPLGAAKALDTHMGVAGTFFCTVFSIATLFSNRWRSLPSASHVNRTRTNPYLPVFATHVCGSFCASWFRTPSSPNAPSITKRKPFQAQDESLEWLDFGLFLDLFLLFFLSLLKTIWRFQTKESNGFLNK